MMIPLSEPVFKGNEKEYISRALDTSLTVEYGDLVEAFEEKLADYLGVPFVVAVNSGTAALHLSLLDVGVGPGDKVLVPSITFIATINAVKYCGAEPVFVGCDKYLNMDEEAFEEAVGREVLKAVVPVHIFGNPVNPDLYDHPRVIEDATEALGSSYGSECKCGAFGEYGCLSFNFNKIITTGGGGAIAVRDRKSAAHLRYLASQAKTDLLYGIHGEVGYNYRMGHIHAAIGLAQLEQLEDYLFIKAKHFQHYVDRLGDLVIQPPLYGKSNHWFYAIRTPLRDKILRHLRRNNIESRPLWYPNHLQEPYKDCKAYGCESAELAAREVLCLPCSVSLTDNDIEEVCRRVLEVL
jgi:perosamine synthetase